MRRRVAAAWAAVEGRGLAALVKRHGEEPRKPSGVARNSSTEQTATLQQ